MPTSDAEQPEYRELFDFFRGRRGDGGPQGHMVGVVVRSEQLPDPANRVTLADERDRYDVPRAHLHVRLTDADWRTAETMVNQLAHGFAVAGIGYVKLLPRAAGVAAWGAHQMGTTRMGGTPRTGVVDTDCRVFSVPNLFIAGGSVFPTVGWANPTLNLLALALRLGDRLKLLLGRS